MTEKEVHSALLSKDPHDQLAIAYNLIQDNKRIESETSKLDIKDFYVASSPPSSLQESPGRSSSAAGSSRQRMYSGGSTCSEKGKSTPMKKAKWHLGMLL